MTADFNPNHNPENGEFSKGVSTRVLIEFAKNKTTQPAPEYVTIKESDTILMHPDKVFKFVLAPNGKHSSDFFDVGYTLENVGKLFDDIENQFNLSEAINIRKQGEEGFSFAIHMQLGIIEKKRFRTVWSLDGRAKLPRFISGFREDGK